MFKTVFSKFLPQEEEVEYHSDDNIEEEEDEEPSNRETITEYILGTPIYSAKVLHGIQHEKFITRISKLIPNISSWAYNRSIDESHCKRIQEELVAMKHPHLIGSFKIAKSSDENQPMKLLDGHHRKYALETILKSNPEFDMEVEVDVYYVEDVENCDKELREIFIRANNNRNVSITDVPSIVAVEVIDKMIAKWPNNIKTDDSKGAIKPNITKRELYKNIKDTLEKDRLSGLNAEQIFTKIEAMNNKLRLMPIKELFNRANPSQKKLNSHEKALKHGFFLNLDCEYPLEKWLNML
jgi:hypothetical protein